MSSVSEPSSWYTVALLLPKLDSALSTDIRLDAYLKAMKYAQRADLPQQLQVFLVPELTDVDRLEPPGGVL